MYFEHTFIIALKEKGHPQCSGGRDIMTRVKQTEFRDLPLLPYLLIHERMLGLSYPVATPFKTRGAVRAAGDVMLAIRGYSGYNFVVERD
jgi:hypothetical protein